MKSAVSKYVPIVIVVAAMCVAVPRLAAEPDFVPGQVIILGMVPQHLISNVLDYPLLAQHNIHVVAVQRGTEQKTVNALIQQGIRAELNYIAHPCDEPAYSIRLVLIRKNWRQIPNDPFLSQQWSLDNPATGVDINYLSVYPWVSVTPGVPIAILDTGFVSHIELDEKVIASKNFMSDIEPPVDSTGHGSHVATTAAAVTDNAVGISGVCPTCQLLNAKVCGTWVCPYGAIARGIIWAVDNGAKVISMSLAGSTPSEAMQAAVEYAVANDVLVIAAAGNSGGNHKMYPCACDGVLCVSATNLQDERAPFSSWGWWVDMGGPGVNILALAGQKWGYKSGTSMATPHVSGAAGVIRSQCPGLDANETALLLYETALDLGPKGPDEQFGHGRLNLVAAIRNCGSDEE